jgi:hypothetical protein
MRQGPRFAAVERLTATEADEPPSDDGGTFIVRSTA